MCAGDGDGDGAAAAAAVASQLPKKNNTLSIVEICVLNTKIIVQLNSNA